MSQVKMNPLSRDLGDALLMRHKKICSQMPKQEDCVEDKHIQAAIISYRDLLASIGAPESLAPSVGKYLFEVARWCVDRGYPPVNALAVNSALRKPGAGYFLAPGGEDWDTEVKQCIACDKYPLRIAN